MPTIKQCKARPTMKGCGKKTYYATWGKEGRVKVQKIKSNKNLTDTSEDLMEREGKKSIAGKPYKILMRLYKKKPTKVELDYDRRACKDFE